MRRGEILSLKWSDVDLIAQTAYLPKTKNGTSRTVPLSTKAIEILKNTPPSPNEFVFPIKGPNLSKKIELAREKANIKNFHFHDLRHMAITRIATKVPNLIELSAVSGHKSLSMLKRYYHPNPIEIAKKLG
jgi:integrase